MLLWWPVGLPVPSTYPSSVGVPVPVGVGVGGGLAADLWSWPEPLSPVTSNSDSQERRRGFACLLGAESQCSGGLRGHRWRSRRLRSCSWRKCSLWIEPRGPSSDRSTRRDGGSHLSPGMCRGKKGSSGKASGERARRLSGPKSSAGGRGSAWVSDLGTDGF